jgi:hypothetical protein
MIGELSLESVGFCVLSYAYLFCFYASLFLM